MGLRQISAAWQVIPTVNAGAPIHHVKTALVHAGIIPNVTPTHCRDTRQKYTMTTSYERAVAECNGSHMSGRIDYSKHVCPRCKMLMTDASSTA